jgi:hypothetical protein
MYKNPIQKLAVVVSGDFGAVFIDTIGELTEQGEEGGGGGNRALGMQGSHANFRNQLTGMQSSLLALRQENMELKCVITGLKIGMERNFGIVNGNVRRLAMQPTRNLAVLATTATNQQNQGGVAAHAGGDRAMMLATLMPTPRSLHDLWQEYEFGVGGRKAAKLFSYTERGRSKHKYHRRKIVWDLISGLVRQGHTADAGIDRIYAVYGGQTSVSNIINGLKRDKKNGTMNPNLVI